MLTKEEMKQLILQLAPHSGIKTPLTEDNCFELADSLCLAFDLHQYQLVDFKTWLSNTMLCNTLQAIIIHYSQFLETRNIDINPFELLIDRTLSPEQEALKSAVESEGGIHSIDFDKFITLLETHIPKAHTKFGTSNRLLHAAKSSNYIEKYLDICAPQIDLAMIMSIEAMNLEDYEPPETYLKQIAHIVLQIYSTEYTDAFAKTGPIHITHFFPITEGRRTAEHIIGYWENSALAIRSEPNMPGYFSYTSHGIGTGVYGLGEIADPGRILNDDEKESGYCRVRIERPLKLYDPLPGTNLEHTSDLDRYSQISLTLQEICNEIYLSVVKNPNINRIEGFHHVMEQESTKEKITYCLKQLKHLRMIQDDNYPDLQLMTALEASIAEFNENAVLVPRTEGCSSPIYSISGRELLPMPINYLTKQLGYDGVVGELQMNHFSKGLIKHHLTEEERQRFGKRSVNNLVTPYGSYRMRTFSRFSVDTTDSITISEPTPPTPILSPAPQYFYSKDRNSKK